MKQFFKTLLASFIGALIALVLAGLFTFSLIGSLASFADTESATVPSSAILSLNFNVGIGEQTVEEPFDIGSISPLITSAPSNLIGILPMVQAIDYAATDPAIKFIYINVESLNASISHLEEVRSALVRFRSSGKPIIAYGENFTQGGYYLASAADKIYAHPLGTNEIMGISANIMFFKGALDMLGVDVQLIRHGKYKSAGEQFINTDISVANREQNQAMVNSLWSSISSAICSSRGIEPAEFENMVNHLTLASPTAMKENHLIDDVIYRDQLKEKLCGLFGVEKEEDLKMITIDKYAKARIKPNIKAKAKIAVIFANGEITLGKGGEISSDDYAGIIEKVRKDSTIKAVVLRVNSPGGSAQAAEIIRNELRLLKEVKPIIASYGDYAASGGYWISAGVDKIYTDATTLTGSIGVFSMIPSFEKILDKVHINPVAISSNKHADMYNLYRPFDEEEVAFMQKGVEEVYDNFLSIVANGRGMETTDVDNIAQGRVWTGSESLEIGLTNEKGGIVDAIQYAAIAAGLDNYKLIEFPTVKTGMEKLMETFNMTKASVEKVSDPETLIRGMYDELRSNNGVYARLPYTYEIR